MSEQGQKLTDLKSDGICISDPHEKQKPCAFGSPLDVGDQEIREFWERNFSILKQNLLDRESELSSLRAEVERLQATVEARERLLDRFTANNIKLNEELSGLRAALSEARKEA